MSSIVFELAGKSYEIFGGKGDGRLEKIEKAVERIKNDENLMFVFKFFNRKLGKIEILKNENEELKNENEKLKNLYKKNRRKRKKSESTIEELKNKNKRIEDYMASDFCKLKIENEELKTKLQRLTKN
jgi:hypothetical protein